ncbi:hypothetical protein IAD21_03824 [Abditibacteriota bacterium]|nr:hypothetical protein IAD21_03824 [Abditibacteriota bacterium]
MKLTRMIEEWFLEEMHTLPARDPNHTENCLDFGQIEGAARQPESVSATQLAHIVECSWCRKNWLAFKNLERSTTKAPDLSPVPAEISSASWTPGYALRVSQYLSSACYLAHENNELVPAFFDEEGTLRVRWSGLAQDGPVSVSLYVDGVAQFLVKARVSEGQLEIVEPLAELGQRNVELPASVLLLHPLGEEQV